MAALVSVQDYEQEAHRQLPKAALDYYRSGATEELTLHQNKEAISRWYIRPRMLIDVSNRSMATTILGYNVKVPFAVAPTGLQRMAHPDGEVATARAAGEMGTVFTMTTITTTSLEEIAAQAPDTLRFFQVYIYKDREMTADLVRKAEKAGFTAIVLTVDSQYSSMRRADLRNKFTLPPHLRLANFQTKDKHKNQWLHTSAGGSAINEYAVSHYAPSLTWKDVDWLISLTQLPIVLKGILTGEDARKGMEAGAAAIWVSNHGGRHLDGVPPTIDVLPEVVEAVRGGCEVYVDGGFCQGTDVLKALALGARMVFIGRPLLWGLACGGQEGATKVLQIIADELDSAMSHSGCATVQDITRDLVRHCSTYSRL